MAHYGNSQQCMADGNNSARAGLICIISHIDRCSARAARDRANRIRRMQGAFRTASIQRAKDGKSRSTEPKLTSVEGGAWTLQDNGRACHRFGALNWWRFRQLRREHQSLQPTSFPSRFNLYARPVRCSVWGQREGLSLCYANSDTKGPGGCGKNGVKE
jgi:hypothetical protein